MLREYAVKNRGSLGDTFSDADLVTVLRSHKPPGLADLTPSEGMLAHMVRWSHEDKPCLEK